MQHKDQHYLKINKCKEWENVLTRFFCEREKGVYLIELGEINM